MKHPALLALIYGLWLPWVAVAQEDFTPPPTETAPVIEAAVVGPVLSVKSDAAETKPPVVPKAPAKGDILLNFQNASLADVLSYLSEVAGFIVVQETPVTGTVNVMSKQPITVDDAVDLLNTVLAEKNYAAVRNGRILKIVSRKDAQKQDIPVKAGSDPEKIPRKDGMVTQILPVRYVEAAKLVENLRPLLSPDASISANEASNSILMADTETNIHRIAEIIRAVDTSISSISGLRVYQLQYADSKSLANVITQLFSNDQNSSRNGNGGGGAGGGRAFMSPFAAMMGGGGMRGAGGNTSPQSPAQQAAMRVVAVADEQSNSVIVSAPEAALATITDLVARIDTNIADITETRIFQLQHADSTELANVLNSLYAENGTNSSSTSNRGQTGFGGFGGFGGIGQGRQQGASSSSERSQRTLLQTRVVAVADPRTNSLIVTAARETMTQIALTVGRLDAVDSKKQKVFIHPLENADPDNVATILRGMFGTQGNASSASSQPSSNQLNQRSTNGASSDITNLLNTSGNSGSRGR